MERRGIPSQGGPIAVMLMEHEAERDLLGRMLADLPGISEADAAARDKMLREGQEYLRVRAEHIWKENDVLYAMGRQALVEVDNAELMEGFARINRETYGEGAQAHFVAMVEEIEQGSGAKQRLVRNLSHEQVDAIFEAMPFEVTFVDANDQVAYFNRLDKEKLFPRTRSVIGRKVEKCHPGKSVHMVREIVEGFKAGSRDEASFWIDHKGDKVLIRYYPVRDEAGAYLGVLEVTQSIGAIQKIEGQKRLLD